MIRLLRKAHIALAIEIKSSNLMAQKVFDELECYNNQFDPKVNYEKVTFYAEEDGDFVGGLEGCLAWDVFDISNMVVLKKGQGIGTLLLKKAESFAKERGITKIVTWTLDFQAPDFYSKQGFATLFVVPDFAGSHSCHYLIKRI